MATVDSDQAPSAEGAGVDSGSYELIRQRLEKLGSELRDKTSRLNQERLSVFGGVDLAVAGTERIRTENACVPADIIAVGKRLLFGYNVFIGLKSRTTVRDVFSLYRFGTDEDGKVALEPDDDPMLADPRLERDFEELYRYYRDARLEQLRLVDGWLLAIFRTGGASTDLKVLRWRLERDGSLAYEDARGDRNHVRPPSHDFEWTETTREDHVAGKHPHVSIEDEVFVECVGGDLTIKVEDNTEDGQGVFSPSPCEEKGQSLARRGDPLRQGLAP